MASSKSRIVLVMASCLILCFIFVLVVRVMTAAPPPRSELWKQVEEAQQKGLPQTAIKALEPIIESAMADKAYMEAVKAKARKVVFESKIQGNKAEERIKLWEAEIAKVPAEMKPAMHTILAHWYWHYFRNNQFRFLQRTETSELQSGDFTTWSLPRILSEIDRQFTEALANEAELKKIPAENWNDLFEKGTLSDKYRPTAYDLLAFEALSFYSAPEQAGARAEDFFEIDASSPALAPAEEFLKWQPETTDTNSRKLKAIKLYQSLITFHLNDADRAALLDADLQRLQFAFKEAIGEGKTERYKQALKTFHEQFRTHELSALALVRLAELINNEGNPLEAKALAQQAVASFPDSHGGKLAYNLIQQIEKPHVEFVTERVWADQPPVIRLRYKNLTEIHFRMYRLDWVKTAMVENGDPERGYNPENLKRLVNPADVTFSVEVPNTLDHKVQVEEVNGPKNLAPGFYLLFGSPSQAFETSSPIFFSPVWVSNLAIVTRQQPYEPRLSGIVTNAISGDPITAATVKSWYRDNTGQFKEGPTTETNATGIFNLKAEPHRGWRFLVSKDNQSLSSENDYYTYQYNENQGGYQQAILFTDRSLYRPGQTIRYKGIMIQSNQNSNQYEVIRNQTATVQLLDSNRQPIAQHDVRSNDFGSFNGSFIAPTDRLTGNMRIQVVNGILGDVGISVEEYKRPQFEVTLDAPKEAPRLGGEATVAGKAMNYTGVAVGGAKIRYRVIREVRFPIWVRDFYSWRFPPMPGSSQEIAHGAAVTEADGTFTIKFVAKPDRSVLEKYDPVFRFNVIADVTDLTGETRTGSRAIQVGYTALQVNMAIQEWQTPDTPVKIEVATSTHDDVGQTAKGTIKIYALKQPEEVIRPDILGAERPRNRSRGRGAPIPLPEQSADPRSWEIGELKETIPFETNPEGKAELKATLPAGIYRAIAETQDRFGKAVTSQSQLQVIDPAATKFAIKIPHCLQAPRWTLEPGSEFQAIWGTGYDKGQAYIEIEHRRQRIQAFWTDPGQTQVLIKQKITEDMRGGLTLRVTYVRENRAYLDVHQIQVPWTNKELSVKWERFTSKIEPAKKETWTAVISGPDAKRAVAEMVATLYDQSLDAYLPHSWLQRFNVFHQRTNEVNSSFNNNPRTLYLITRDWVIAGKQIDPQTYRHIPDEIIRNIWQQQFMRAGGPIPSYGGMPGMPPPASAAMDRGGVETAARREKSLDALAGADAELKSETTPGPDLSKVTARTNLAETAFFFPHLVSDESGTVRLEFSMPETLTRWKFMGFAHDQNLRSGYLAGETVTAKDLMVKPNPPRFLRVGDVIEFTAKVSNQAVGRQAGLVKLSLADARTGQAVDTTFGITEPEQKFDIASKESQTFSWRITVPEGAGPISYKVVGASEYLSDGEEGILPVLSRKILVTESIPLPIREPGKKTFDFTKLRESGASTTLKHQSLTVQMTSNPAWYAVLALPYLMEYPHECTEQTFNRLYANALARHVVSTDPKIRRVFEQWRNTPALDSPLEKNQDIKAALLEETPWVRDAQNESQARRNVGVLFEENRLNEELARALRKVADQQRQDGAWPWFPGGPKNEYITLYITTGFGRLRHLGVKLDMAPAIKSLMVLDAWVDERYRWILQHSKNKDDNHLTTTIALYLYGRSYFLQDQGIAAQHQEAVNYWLGQARTHWLNLAHRQSQAHLALALKRFGDKKTPADIMASIKEHSVSNEEMGMFWRDLELSWWWYRAPIETQAVMIEAFDEVMNDTKSVEDCKVWLLKQKQTQNWKTTKATADVVYALLLRGDNLLSSDALVQVTLAGEEIKPEKVEAGTGFYEEKFLRTEVKPAMGSITVAKSDPGVAWGSVHWQYLEDIAKITPHEGTPLKLEKKLFRRIFTKSGPKIEDVSGPVDVGDEIVVRIILRTDRDMEYVHLKDHRGSGTEPTNVLSRYRYQDGLAYYESTKDTASHFFIDYLPKGTYVFEYAVRVQLRGEYPTGLAFIECMYAPEFNSHSESLMLQVK